MLQRRVLMLSALLVLAHAVRAVAAAPVLMAVAAVARVPAHWACICIKVLGVARVRIHKYV
eukprot:366278-Chlamydomonas_euryale.AAC.61